MQSHLTSDCSVAWCDRAPEAVPRWHHKFRQSWLKTADTCPELARQEHAKLTEDWETDAACIGTAVHASAEWSCAQLEEGRVVSLQAALETFEAAWVDLQDQENFRWVKYSPRSALKFGQTCVREWHSQILPTMTRGAMLEHTFLVNLVDNPDRIIDLSGTIDYVGAEDQAVRLKDWKTSSRGPYTPWEYKRWSVQASVYTYAAFQQGFVEQQPDETIPFEYVVLGDHGAQRFTVTRGPAEWSWLADKASTTALLIEAELPTWPKQDNHALCSPKWCPAWNTCKGSHGVEY